MDGLSRSAAGGDENPRSRHDQLGRARRRGERSCSRMSTAILRRPRPPRWSLRSSVSDGEDLRDPASIAASRSRAAAATRSPVRNVDPPALVGLLAALAAAFLSRWSGAGATWLTWAVAAALSAAWIIAAALTFQRSLILLPSPGRSWPSSPPAWSSPPAERAGAAHSPASALALRGGRAARGHRARLRHGRYRPLERADRPDHGDDA